MPSREKKPMQPEKITLMCGGKKCCPVLETKTDGSTILHDTDDGRDQHVPLDADQTVQLFETLKRALGR
jgi:hypothetical protein